MDNEDHTETNREIMADFAELFYTRGDVATAFEKHVREDYIQHNPGFADGRAAAIAGLSGMFGNPDSRFEVLRLLVDGDLAAVHIRARPAGRPLLSVGDFYRLQDGKIVEHWDMVQPVPEASQNDHPMF